jgi:hypothetical protein
MLLPKATKEDKKHTIEMMLECFDGDAEQLQEFIEEIWPNWNELTNFLVAYEDAEEALAALEKLVKKQGQTKEAVGKATDRSSKVAKRKQ